MCDMEEGRVTKVSSSKKEIPPRARVKKIRRLEAKKLPERKSAETK